MLEGWFKGRFTVLVREGGEDDVGASVPWTPPIPPTPATFVAVGAAGEADAPNAERRLGSGDTAPPPAAAKTPLLPE
jgi:hypothetical protein